MDEDERLFESQRPEPIAIHEARLAELKIRVDGITFSILRSAINLLESQAIELSTIVEATDPGTPPS